jgi:DNA-binding response OmpR family regulator
MTTVMVIEPDILVRMTISEPLRDCGYRVIEGVSAEDVWSVVDSRAPLHIVLANAQLSGPANGFELASQLRQTCPGVDVILTSGIADSVEKSMQLCEQGPVKTPYQPQDVIRRIHLLFERRRGNSISHDD